MKNQTLGRAGEEFAAQYLSALGYRILHRNFRSGHLETDIICENETHILFVEVKSRTDVVRENIYVFLCHIAAAMPIVGGAVRQNICGGALVFADIHIELLEVADCDYLIKDRLKAMCGAGKLVDKAEVTYPLAQIVVDAPVLFSVVKPDVAKHLESLLRLDKIGAVDDLENKEQDIRKVCVRIFSTANAVAPF